MKNITLKELSKMLDVSISTISKALNDSHEISISTKERVREAAKQYNYKPNRTAINLKSGRASTIGVILPSIKNFFLSRALRGIENEVAKTDYNIIICVTNESYKKEVQYVQALTNGLVDAIIIAVSEETQVLENYDHLTNISKYTNLLMFDRVSDDVKCDKVMVNDYEAVLNAVKELQFMGRKRIALAATIHNLSVGQLRIKGYEDAIKDSHEPIIITGPEKRVEKELDKMIESEDIDAIIALDEEASLATFRVGKKKDILDSGKLALVGYAGRTISEHLTPSMTTINQHGKRVGRTAAELLLSRLENNDKEIEKVIIDSSLYKRETTNKPS
ncbi:LacI family DNA-binding transcriptional regulator [Tenacibaculum sp. M341]|uniref:LacI family DNA-binding transcriptional regulator n=1 Tax=Tenacibaculum sp. M341 TaxID=2530339 RepID=UPI0010535604|nr:LacI family DNA-binding transcriptional regulator [Tenacibaculum sp. M341]TCI95043.1 LacI family transcriptional regulator [Tenacibaculum sp. M341]